MIVKLKPPLEVLPAYCQHPGCTAFGEVCTNRFDDDWYDEVYCFSHAAEHGYCSLCGSFEAGISSFEATGLCDDCLVESEEYNYTYVHDH